MYNNVFQLIKTFTPKKPLKRYKQTIKLYDTQKCGDHCKALILRENIQLKYPDYDFDVLEKKESKVNNENLIIPKKKCFHKYNETIAAWDIETSLNANNEHIPYACSIAWYDYDYGEEIFSYINKKTTINKKVVWKKVEVRTKNIIQRHIKEQNFWGLDCLQNMTTWIYENEDIFNGYTLYAHNVGKYDLPLEIKKAFIESPEFLIEGKGCVGLNNAWIGFTLRSRTNRKFKIFFRDNYRYCLCHWPN